MLKKKLRNTCSFYNLYFSILHWNMFGNMLSLSLDGKKTCKIEFLWRNAIRDVPMYKIKIEYAFLDCWKKSLFFFLSQFCI